MGVFSLENEPGSSWVTQGIHELSALCVLRHTALIPTTLATQGQTGLDAYSSLTLLIPQLLLQELKTSQEEVTSFQS